MSDPCGTGNEPCGLRGDRREGGVALPLALLLLIAVTLLAHALWVLGELEVRITQAEVERVTANYQARAEVAARSDSIRASGPDSLSHAGGRPVLRRIEVGGGIGEPGWASLALVPTPRSVVEEAGAGVVVGQIPDASTAARIGVSSGSCLFPLGGLWRDWSAEPGRPPTVSGLPIAAAIGLLPKLAGPWHSVAPDSLGLSLIGGRAGPVHLDGVGTVLIGANGILIKSGAVLSGVLISTAGVEIEAGAHFEGLAITFEGLRIQAGATLRASSCAAESALAGTPLLDPRRIGPAGWPVR